MLLSSSTAGLPRVDLAASDGWPHRSGDERAWRHDERPECRGRRRRPCRCGGGSATPDHAASMPPCLQPSARLRACRCRSSPPPRRSSQDRRRHRCRASRCADHPPRCRRAGGERNTMRLPATFMLAACLLATAAPAAPPVPTIFAPDSIAGAADDGAAAFTPDGATVYFMRGTDSFTLVESHRVDGHWSTPKAAPFSGRWRDLDPAMAPDG